MKVNCVKINTKKALRHYRAYKDKLPGLNDTIISENIGISRKTLSLIIHKDKQFTRESIEKFASGIGHKAEEYILN